MVTSPPMHSGDPLKDQDWGRISAQLSAFAYRRTARRSWEYARDLAHDAIVQELAAMEAPERANSEVPLLKAWRYE